MLSYSAGYSTTKGHDFRYGVMASDLVGRTGFEPVTSSVSGKSRAVPGVCHRRIESNGEPLTCTNIPSKSRGVWGQLNTLAPICGSRCSCEDAVGLLGPTASFSLSQVRPFQR